METFGVYSKQTGRRVKRFRTTNPERFRIRLRPDEELRREVSPADQRPRRNRTRKLGTQQITRGNRDSSR